MSRPQACLVSRPQKNRAGLHALRNPLHLLAQTSGLSTRTPRAVLPRAGPAYRFTLWPAPSRIVAALAD